MLGIAAKAAASDAFGIAAVKKEISLAVDPNGDHPIFFLVQMRKHGRRGAAGDRVLLPLAPKQKGYGFLHTITSTAII